MIVPRPRHSFDAHARETTEWIAVGPVAVLLLRCRRPAEEAVRAAAQRVDDARVDSVADDHRKTHIRHRGVPLLADRASRIIGMRLGSGEG